MPRADKAAFIQGMLSEHQPRQQREATKPAPDSKEWWRDVAQGLGVELAALRATIAEQAATIARLEAGMPTDMRTTLWSRVAEANARAQHAQTELDMLRATIARLEGERDKCQYAALG